MTILWLHSPTNLSAGYRSMCQEKMRALRIDPAQVRFVDPYFRARQSKVIYDARGNPVGLEEPDALNQAVFDYMAMFRPSLVIINDPGVLSLFSGGQLSLHTCRGSIYEIRSGIYGLVFDDMKMVNATHHGEWVLVQDLLKMKRWYEGKQRNEPKFDYVICETADDVAFSFNCLDNCLLVSCDIETLGDFITCIGYSGLRPDGSVKSFVIPFFNPLKLEQAHWQDVSDEEFVWSLIRTFHDNDIPKIFQNGTYDCTYLINYQCPPRNYLLDTANMWHSLWPMLPKKLNFIASLCLDYYKYWKDDIKGDTDEDERIPTNTSGYYTYLRYNGLDCHYTLLSCLYLLRVMAHPERHWSLRNYNREFKQQIGPALSGTMRGLLVDVEQRGRMVADLLAEHTTALNDLRLMTADPQFNPGSRLQVAELLYDTLGARPIKLGKGKNRKSDTERAVGEKILELIATQHPIFKRIVEQIFATKKPLNNVAKYGNMSLLNNRFMYTLNAAGTKFGRYSSQKHPWRYGNNAQNLPEAMRKMCRADEGWFLFEADYSQSDAWFVAFSGQDQRYMDTMRSPRDTHCIHAEFFFKKPYDDIYLAYKKKEDWAVHPTKGVRQNTKRIVHGANYNMEGRTLFVQIMGRDAAIASAKFLGYVDADSWSDDKLIDFCNSLLQAFHQLYPGLKPWQRRIVDDCLSNHRLAINAYGRACYFHGDLQGNKGLQRELSSYYGQSGTADNINRTLDTHFYESGLEDEGLLFLLQTHDSNLMTARLEDFHLCEKFLTIMEQPVTLHGRTFTVPVEAKVGIYWGDRKKDHPRGMIEYRKGMDVKEFLV